LRADDERYRPCGFVRCFDLLFQERLVTEHLRRVDWNRRDWLRTVLQSGMAGSVTGTLLSRPLVWADAAALKIATFDVDVTPPMGHPCCGGWITPVKSVDDPLHAMGLVITGAGDPIVLCAVDWTGILNQAHVRWRTALAQAVGTTAERVAVQCVHQHDAPFVCLDAKQLCEGHPGLENALVDLGYFEQVVERVADAARKSLQNLRPLTHVATSQAKVERVAGNRRFVDEQGKLYDWRGSSSKNPVHKELPEGLIDPFLKTVAFYDGNERIAVCHYYACHPMSHYGQGAVSSEFVGLARRRIQTEIGQGLHLYFTGCSGNIAAGKYNDGTPQARLDMTDRMAAAMKQSLDGLVTQPVSNVSWQTVEIVPQPRTSWTENGLQALIADSSAALALRIRPAMMLAWMQRCQQQIPIVLSALHLGDVSLLHLPAESFVQYQLRAQAAAPQRFIATAAYGDGGPWYIPTAADYPHGGYEVSVAFSEPGIDDLLTQGVLKLATRS
jgi:hypothetical protein